MTFRNIPDSREKYCNKDQPSSNNNRPRNHHAPDPPSQPPRNSHSDGGSSTARIHKVPNNTVTGLNSDKPIDTLENGQEIVTTLVENPALSVNSPSSSGYGSLLQSQEGVSQGKNKKVTKDNDNATTKKPKGPNPYFVSKKKKKPTKVTWACTCSKGGKSHCPLNQDGPEVPSTIHEESDSCQKSKGVAYVKT